MHKQIKNPNDPINVTKCLENLALLLKTELVFG